MVIYENTKVTNIKGDEKSVHIQAGGKSIMALRAVVSCGRWISELLPEFKQLVRPIQQSLIYLEMENKDQYRLGSYPTFYFFEDNLRFYAVPDIKGEVVKIGHRLQESADHEKTSKFMEEKMVSKYFPNRIKKVVRT